jgi:putative RNA 2'-phosphotransferase
LDKRQRQHVHLSSDMETALKVGKRHGKPVIFEVKTGQMFAEGLVFYQSENQVWLTDHVPNQFLAQLH